jgi:hypothetical protein
MKKILIPVLALLLAPVVCIKSFNRLSAEIKWCEIAQKSLAGQTEQSDTKKVWLLLKNVNAFGRIMICRY